jgi:NAD-dependent SIR2 family protein deacetylase
MIAGLSQAVQDAKPTPFHELLNTLDRRGQLIRCYTQNIDSLEEKVGLSYGVPAPPQRKSPKKRPPPVRSQSPSGSPATPAPSVDTTPRCIPLHGTLKNLHCRACSATFPLADSLHLFVDGTIPPCPQCSEFETTRQIVGKRSRGVGILRPSIVLYGEEHREGEGVGDIVKRDLTGGKNRRAPPDLLLVVGTSLRGVPGTKRIVKEFSKAARSGLPSASPPCSQPSTPSASRKASPAEAPDDHPMRTVYLNLDFPMPARDWESTFDVWVQGDLQDVAARVQVEIALEEEAKRRKEERKHLTGEKRKRFAEDDDGWFASRTTPGKRSRRNNHPLSGSRVRKELDTKLETVKQEQGDGEWNSHLPVSYPSTPSHRTGEIHVTVSCPGVGRRQNSTPTRPLLPVLLPQSLPPTPLKTGGISHSPLPPTRKALPIISTGAQQKMSLAHITNALDDQRPTFDRGFGHAVRSRRLSISDIAPPVEVNAHA